jgi:hypothetical protein
MTDRAKRLAQHCESPSLGLALADGQRWVIRALDDEAATTVVELGRVMRLGPGKDGREMRVAVGSRTGPADLSVSTKAPVECWLTPSPGGYSSANRMERVASAIALQSLAHHGLLLHAALAVLDGSGFILAGVSGAGKSTASRRLPVPWRSLSDDATLVVRGRAGQYWAHPWPTWSRLRDGGSTESWPVEHAVPLRAMFLLSKADSDRLESVAATTAAAVVLESAVNLCQTVVYLADTGRSSTLCRLRTPAAMALARAVQAYSLQVTLKGQFWKGIEHVLPKQELGQQPSAGRPVSVESRATRLPGPMNAHQESEAVVPHSRGDGLLRFVYTGTSMNPTLLEPDVIEVKPYGDWQPQLGDVVCFRSPARDVMVVHRVVRVEPAGVRTKGDNCPQVDLWVLRPEGIIGRVVAAQRGARRRDIKGGKQGLWVAALARLRRVTRSRIGQILRGLGQLAVELGPFDFALPPGLRPKLVRFEARHRINFKLLMGGLVVGRYDYLSLRWKIRRPFRLFVSESSLAAASLLASSQIHSWKNRALEIQPSAVAGGALPVGSSDREDRVPGVEV